MNHSMLVKRAISEAHADVERFGFSMQSMVFAQYTNAEGEQAIRPFQWRRRESRIEFDRLVSWAVNNNRMVMVTPFERFMKTTKMLDTSTF